VRGGRLQRLHQKRMAGEIVALAPALPEHALAPQLPGQS
jgi:hypothetical protein